MSQSLTTQRTLFDLIEQEEERKVKSVLKPVQSQPVRSKFPGESVDAELDDARLTGLQLDIFNLMKDAEWRTHGEMKAAIGHGSENGIAALLRNLRDKRRGHHTVNKRRRGDPHAGLWEYQLIVNKSSRKP